MANSLTIKQKAQELQVGDRRAIKTSLIPSFYISMEEGASIATPTQGEQTEGVRENSFISAFTSLSDAYQMGNTCKSMADSCQCIAKTTTIL